MVLGRKKGWIGIDFGSRTLTIAQAERTDAGVRVAASAAIQRPLMVDQMSQPHADGCHWQGRDILAALSLDTGFCGRTVACALPMCLTDFHVLTVPPAPEAEQRAMIAQELSSVFIHDEQEREFDFWEANADPTPDTSPADNVNVLSVPRHLVARAVRGISDAGLHCEVMDGLPFALARAVDLVRGPGEAAPVGAVHWGFTSGTFCVVYGRAPRFTRHLRNCGVGSLVARVASALGLSDDEAVQVLADHGLPGPECRQGTQREIQEAVAEVAAQQLNQMAEELTRTIAYVRMKYPAMVPERLCLFGAGANVKHVPFSISQRVGLPSDVWMLPSSENEDDRASRSATPSELLGTAVALSALAWAS